MQEYDIIIIGGGPAGLTAAIYSARAKMKTLIIGDMVPGGQTMLTDRIDNYPGIESISGMDLMMNMYKQVETLNVPVVTKKATEIIQEEKGFIIKTKTENFKALSVIIATGATYKFLGAKGEKEFGGRGVSYCGICDAPFFKDKEIAVIGGGDTAVYETVHLLKYASKIHLIHRKDRLRATKIMQDKVIQSPKTDIHWNSVLEEISGEKTVEKIRIKNVKTEVSSEIKVDGVFVFVGIQPLSGIVNDIVTIDKKGYILTDQEMHSSCKGVFACGDVRAKALRQVSTAVGEAAAAAFSAQQYVEKLKGEAYL
ncbi:MAG: thioredoxin-disulfide reductase [Candidatus Omnitrophica bacterium]|nr:thioredoxin-disulfide reductase [Candidatus Omnitrophota bacterium]